MIINLKENLKIHKNMYPAEKLWWKNYEDFLKKYKIKNIILLNVGK
jgi:hypothetical protein